jgi:hypothetical protein
MLESVSWLAIAVSRAHVASIPHERHTFLYNYHCNIFVAVDPDDCCDAAVV